jgi:hypothetical protein
MASKYSTEQFIADEILLEKIYRFAGYKKEHLSALKRAVRQGDLAMESMVENAISRIGKLERTNKQGMDFVDGSDAKKVTVVNQGTIKVPNRGAGFSTRNKKGILRVVVVDSMIGEVFYFKVPPEFYVNVTQRRRETALRIRFSKNGGKPAKFTPNGTSEEMWSFQVKSFKELCK